MGGVYAPSTRGLRNGTRELLACASRRGREVTLLQEPQRLLSKLKEKAELAG